ncbi:ankyrin repeat domain-containing protein [Gammaproteobacteria bacterium]|nr:ankyrin repeat domain-containing protein [Gammaproteobacteria bacterium]
MKALFGEDYENLPAQKQIDRLKNHLNRLTLDEQEKILSTKYDDQYLADWMYGRFATQPHLLDQFWDLVKHKSFMTDNPGVVWLTAIRYGVEINYPFDGQPPLHVWLQRCGQVADDQKAAYVHLAEKTIDHSDYNLLAQDDQGNNALHIAIRWGQTDLASKIIDKGCRRFTGEERKTFLNKKNNDKQSPLSIAVSKGDITSILNLLENGASYNLNEKDGDRYLGDLVCQDGSKDQIKQFWQIVGVDSGFLTAHMPIVWRSKVEHGGDPNIIFSGMPPLHFVHHALDQIKKTDDEDKKNSYTEVAEYIINRKDYNLLAADDVGNTALHVAIRWGQTDLALKILGSSCLTDDTKQKLLNLENKDKQSALSIAVSEVDVTSILNLLENSASYNLSEKYGDRYLVDLVCKDGNQDQIKQFWQIVGDSDCHTDNFSEVWQSRITHGGDPNSKFGGVPPLHYVLDQIKKTDDKDEKKRYIQLAEGIINRKGYNLLATDKDGNTFLHHACKNGPTNLVSKILGAPHLTKEKKQKLLNLENNDKQSALSIAVPKIYDLKTLYHLLDLVGHFQSNVARILILLENDASYNLNEKYSDRYLVDSVCEHGNKDQIKQFWQIVGVNSGFTITNMPIVWKSKVEHGGDPNALFKDMPPLHYVLKQIYKTYNSEQKRYKELAEDIISLKDYNLLATDQYGKTALHRACKNCQIDIALKIINALDDEARRELVNIKDYDEQTAFHIMLSEGRYDIAQKTLAYIEPDRLSVPMYSTRQDTVLHFLVRELDSRYRCGSSGDQIRQLIQGIVKKYPELLFYENFRSRLPGDITQNKEIIGLLNFQKEHIFQLDTWLDRQAVGQVDKQVFEDLLEKRVQKYDKGEVEQTGINQKVFGKQLIHLAAKKNHPSIISILKQYGEDLDAKDYQNETALKIASTNGYVESVEVLLAMGAKAHCYQGMDSVGGKRNIQRLMILYGLIDGLDQIRTDGGDQYLQERQQLYENLQTLGLIKAQSTESIPTQPGSSVIDQEKLVAINAEIRPYLNTLRMIQHFRDLYSTKTTLAFDSSKQVSDFGDVRFDFTIDDEKHEGKTALHYMCRAGQTSAIEAIIKKGAHVDVQDKDGRTPLIVAIKYRQYDVIQLLVKYGCDLTKRNNKGESAHDLAQAADGGRFSLFRQQLISPLLTSEYHMSPPIDLVKAENIAHPSIPTAQAFVGKSDQNLPMAEVVTGCEPSAPDLHQTDSDTDSMKSDQSSDEDIKKSNTSHLGGV